MGKESPEIEELHIYLLILCHFEPRQGEESFVISKPKARLMAPVCKPSIQETEIDSYKFKVSPGYIVNTNLTRVME